MYVYGNAMAKISLKNRTLVRWYGGIPSIALPLALCKPLLKTIYLWCYLTYLLLIILTVIEVTRKLHNVKGLLRQSKNP